MAEAAERPGTACRQRLAERDARSAASRPRQLQLGPQILPSPGALVPVAKPAEQLQMVNLGGPALLPGADGLNLPMPHLAMPVAAPAGPAWLAVKQPLGANIFQSNERADIGTRRNGGADCPWEEQPRSIAPPALQRRRLVDIWTAAAKFSIFAYSFRQGRGPPWPA